MQAVCSVCLYACETVNKPTMTALEVWTTINQEHCYNSNFPNHYLASILQPDVDGIA